MKRILVALFAALALAVPAAAVADSCTNVSRAAPACDPNCTGPVIEGNWVWLPSIGEPIQAWGFAPPGAEDSVTFHLPGASGNYTDGKTSSLLGRSAICQAGGNVDNVRQGSSGIQSGCDKSP